MMRQRKIICEHCGSAKIVKHNEIDYAEVQGMSIDIRKPAGPVKANLVLKCRSCGEMVCLEKFKTSDNTSQN